MLLQFLNYAQNLDYKKKFWKPTIIKQSRMYFFVINIDFKYLKFDIF